MTVRSAKILLTAAMAGSLLSGCVVADAVWDGTKSVGKFVYSPVKSLLRKAPEQTVEYADYDYTGGEVELYDATVLPDTYAYSDGTSYTPAPTSSAVVQPSYAPSPYIRSDYVAPSYGNTDQYGRVYYAETASAEPVAQVAQTATADSLSFVRLNGESNMRDWQTCENLYRGYWLIDAAGGRINPKFESCMRNKGYVLEAELAAYGFKGETPISAPNQTAAQSFSYGYTANP